MALVNNVRASVPSWTSALLPFSHATGSVTVAPAATYHAQAESSSESRTFTARLAIPATAISVTTDVASACSGARLSQTQQPSRIGAEDIGAGPIPQAGHSPGRGSRRIGHALGMGPVTADHVGLLSHFGYQAVRHLVG